MRKQGGMTGRLLRIAQKTVLVLVLAGMVFGNFAGQGVVTPVKAETQNNDINKAFYEVTRNGGASYIDFKYKDLSGEYNKYTTFESNDQNYQPITLYIAKPLNSPGPGYNAKLNYTPTIAVRKNTDKGNEILFAGYFNIDKPEVDSNDLLIEITDKTVKFIGNRNYNDYSPVTRFFINIFPQNRLLYYPVWLTIPTSSKSYILIPSQASSKSLSSKIVTPEQKMTNITIDLMFHGESTIPPIPINNEPPDVTYTAVQTKALTDAKSKCKDVLLTKPLHKTTPLPEDFNTPALQKLVGKDGAQNWLNANGPTDDKYFNNYYTQDSGTSNAHIGDGVAIDEFRAISEKFDTEATGSYLEKTEWFKKWQTGLNIGAIGATGIALGAIGLMSGVGLATGLAGEGVKASFLSQAILGATGAKWGAAIGSIGGAAAVLTQVQPLPKELIDSYIKIDIITYYGLKHIQYHDCVAEKLPADFPTDSQWSKEKLAKEVDAFGGIYVATQDSDAGLLAGAGGSQCGNIDTNGGLLREPLCVISNFFINLSIAFTQIAAKFFERSMLGSFGDKAEKTANTPSEFANARTELDARVEKAKKLGVYEGFWKSIGNENTFESSIAKLKGRLDESEKINKTITDLETQIKGVNSKDKEKLQTALNAEKKKMSDLTTKINEDILYQKQRINSIATNPGDKEIIKN